MSERLRVTVHVDGGARGNPGPAVNFAGEPAPEVGTERPDYVEIQNVHDVEATSGGYVVAVNNALVNDINAVSQPTVGVLRDQGFMAGLPPIFCSPDPSRAEGPELIR